MHPKTTRTNLTPKNHLFVSLRINIEKNLNKISKNVSYGNLCHPPRYMTAFSSIFLQNPPTSISVSSTNKQLRKFFRFLSEYTKRNSSYLYSKQHKKIIFSVSIQCFFGWIYTMLIFFFCWRLFIQSVPISGMKINL